MARVVWQEARKSLCQFVVTFQVLYSLVTLLTHVGSGLRGLLVSGTLRRLGLTRHLCEVVLEGWPFGSIN